MQFLKQSHPKMNDDWTYGALYQASKTHHALAKYHQEQASKIDQISCVKLFNEPELQERLAKIWEPASAGLSKTSVTGDLGE
jgi:hypothetical protein